MRIVARFSQRQRIDDYAPLRLAVAAALLLALGYVLRKKSATEAFAFGYVPFFLLSTGTYYYHVARVTLVLFHAFALASKQASSPSSAAWVKGEKLRHQVGLAFFFLLEVHSNSMFYFFDNQEVFWTGWLSRGLFAYCLGMTAWLFYEDRWSHERNARKNPDGIPGILAPGLEPADRSPPDPSARTR